MGKSVSCQCWAIADSKHSSNPMDDDDHLTDVAHATPAYKRALWLVMALNLGYGIIETYGGFLVGSQSLKADALDFVGDGAITLLGLIAIGWGAVWRARAAFLQGIFLGVLGIAVLAGTTYRVFVLHVPGAEVMGVLGTVGLAINLGSAAALMKHRTGDANVRAVWLFSRNDALGNLAVIIAAALVWMSASPWPDVVVAVVIAGLFIHSSWLIINHARAELVQAN